MSMKYWEILNSNFVLTLFGLLWGSVAAGWISSLWQKRQNRHEMKLKLAQDILLDYHTYLRLLRRDFPRNHGEEFDRAHAHILSSIKMSGLLFRDETVKIAWDEVVNGMTKVKKLRSEMEHRSIDMEPIYLAASKATEAMFRELQV